MNSDPELCRRVAEACGFTPCPKDDGHFIDPRGTRWPVPENPGHGMSRADWVPDRDWDHAMLAAEFFGLLDELSMGRVHTNEDGWEWMVFDPDDDAICITHAHGPTAICHAIVRLADA